MSTDHDLPTFEEMFAAAFDCPQTPERRALSVMQHMTAKDAAGIYYMAWSHMRQAWKPGRANFRESIGSRFCKLLKLQEGTTREFATDPSDLERMQLEDEGEQPLERWRTADSCEIDRLLDALRDGADKSARTARRHRAKLLARVQINGDLFGGAA